MLKAFISKVIEILFEIAELIKNNSTVHQFSTKYCKKNLTRLNFLLQINEKLAICQRCYVTPNVTVVKFCCQIFLIKYPT